MLDELKEPPVAGYFLNDPRFEAMLMYTYGRIIDEMPEVCREFGPRCHFKAMGQVFPDDDDVKNAYFVDDVHLNDEGNELIVDYYAKVILESHTQ